MKKHLFIISFFLISFHFFSADVTIISGEGNLYIKESLGKWQLAPKTFPLNEYMSFCTGKDKNVKINAGGYYLTLEKLSSFTVEDFSKEGDQLFLRLYLSYGKILTNLSKSKSSSLLKYAIRNDYTTAATTSHFKSIFSLSSIGTLHCKRGKVNVWSTPEKVETTNYSEFLLVNKSKKLVYYTLHGGQSIYITPNKEIVNPQDSCQIKTDKNTFSLEQ